MNDAAERLRDDLTVIAATGMILPADKALILSRLDAALAAEWDAGVKVGAARERERIREAVLILDNDVLAILDAEVVEHPVLDDNDR